jgi:transposase
MSATAATIQVVEYSMDELRSIIERSREGLSEADREKLWSVIESYAQLLEELGDKKASIARLRQMVFGQDSESKANVKKRAGKSGNGGKDQPKKKKKRKGHGRIPADDYTGADRVKVPHPTLKPGVGCPNAGCCGKVYGKDDRKVVRIVGSAPFVATVFEQACVRCNLCGEVFTAQLPPEVGEAKFDHTVASMAAFLRYGNGLPMNRIQELQKVVGVPFPASVQWELMRDAARKMEAVYLEHIRQAAQGEVLHNDDTPMKILDFLVEKKKREERGQKPPERTGTYTSGIVSKLADDRVIALYFTGQKHAGENLARVLAERVSGMDPPMQM